MNKAYNKDIMDWDEFPHYDIVWTDPPWEERMVKWFQGKCKKETGLEVNHTIREIIGHLAKLSNPTKPVVIEYGIKGYDLVIEIMEAFGHKHISTNKRVSAMCPVYVVMVFNSDLKIPELKDPYLITEFFKENDFKTAFDPFAGIGATAKAVMKSGAYYIGSELNPKRYERLKKIIDESNQKGF
jgi:hypothetical protein